MGSKGNAWENLVLDRLFGGTAINWPGTIYVGLWTATLDDTSTGATAGECNYTNYARVAKATGTANWTAASGGTVYNEGAISFPQAGGDQTGTVTDFALVTSSSGAGTILYYGALTASKVIQNGDTPSFADGVLTISED